MTTVPSASVGTTPGNALQDLLCAPDIVPGDVVSYETCKEIYLYHPLGSRIVEGPVSLAMAQKRTIKVPDSPGEYCVDAFVDEWKNLAGDFLVHNLLTVSRIYGVASIALLVDGLKSNEVINYWDLPDLNISFNILDPLNTSGSLVLNQNPNAMDFMKYTQIAVAGTAYHPSRTVTITNEKPIYLGYTTSAFGYVGRSAYQRAFYPLKSYIKSLIADDLVETKVGVLVAKIKQPGNFVDNIMSWAAGFKRSLVKEAETGNVLNITPEEDIESLNMQNLEGPHVLARRNILENIANAVDMPVKLLTQESFAEGFGEGSEDAKAVARYMDRLRETMDPVYRFLDRIVMHRAWTPAFFKMLRKKFPEKYADTTYREAFYEWTNSYLAVWPSYLREPDSDQVKVDDTKMKAAISVFQILELSFDPENRTRLVQWLADAVTNNKLLYSSPLELDYQVLLKKFQDMEEQEDKEQEAALMGGMGGGPGGGKSNGGAADPRKVQIPKVKMARADDASVIRLLEHIQNASAVASNQGA
jgi:hypothetical protein